MLHDSASSRFAQASPSFSAVLVLVLSPPLQSDEHLPQAAQGPIAQETEKKETYKPDIYLLLCCYAVTQKLRKIGKDYKNFIVCL